MLIDLLYIDRERLDRYSTQIEPASAAIVKTKKLSTELSLLGPKAIVGQEDHVRPLTDFEKMELVKESLTKGRHIRHSRPESEDDGPEFVLERTLATKVIVPPANSRGLDISEFTLWFSSAPAGSRAAMLCLLQDFRGDDTPPTSFRNASTYTLLQSLIYYTRSRELRTLLDDHVQDEPHPNPYARFDGKPDSLSQYHNVREYAYEFATSPAALLSQWGAIASSERQIDVLYRIREFGRDSAHSWERVSVFGYPIWISATSV